jgi:hypothetical protein
LLKVYQFIANMSMFKAASRGRCGTFYPRCPAVELGHKLKHTQMKILLTAKSMTALEVPPVCKNFDMNKTASLLTRRIFYRRLG